MTRVDESVEAIKKMIINKQYNENGFLPSEGELSTTLSVSRATIREAVRTLEVRGYLERIHGKGIKVLDNGMSLMVQPMHDLFEKEDISLDDVLEVRWIIETKAATLAVQRANENEIDELFKIVERMEDIDVINDQYLQYDFEFHKRLVECSKNSMLIAITYAYSSILLELIESSSKTTVNLENMYHYHRNICKALECRNQETVQKVMEEHLLATSVNKKLNS